MKIIYSKNENQKSLVRAYPNDSGVDVYALSLIELKPFERITVKTGYRFDIKRPFWMRLFFPKSLGVELQVRPKSSLSMRGIECSLGTIDEDYLGEVGVTITNFSNEKVVFLPGEKIAQIVVMPVFNRVKFKEIKTIFNPKKQRGIRGFGSSLRF